MVVPVVLEKTDCRTDRHKPTPMLTVMRIYNSVKTKKNRQQTFRIVLSGISFDERHNPTVLGLTKLIRTCAVSQYTEGFTHIAMTSTNL